MTQTKPRPITPLDYRHTAEEILKGLKRDRDRQIIARRFGFGLPKRQTLEKIGQDFDITRERVRQIEKAAIAKLSSQPTEHLENANQLLVSYLEPHGQVALIDEIGQKLGATTPAEQAYVVFLAKLADDIELIDEDEELNTSLARLPHYSKDRVKSLSADLISAIKSVGKPTTLPKLAAKLPAQLPLETLSSVAKATKSVANFENKWGLATWPEVNPRSIRDKTYLVLGKHGQPLHFADIAERIKNVTPGKRQVTVQAVHNELIKDPRFVLIGRGIYALAEWGYTPGTVADIIIGVLEQESPLHKDEIVRRVLTKRQVKTTTIILNLQEKDQFERVAKATYKLRE